MDIKTIRYVVNSINIEDWTTTREIIERVYDLHGYRLTPREWRSWVADYNANYVTNGGRRYFIASSNKGYCKTKRSDLILATVNRRRNRLHHEWMKSNQLLKALGENNNERFEIDG